MSDNPNVTVTITHEQWVEYRALRRWRDQLERKESRKRQDAIAARQRKADRLKKSVEPFSDKRK